MIVPRLKERLHNALLRLAKEAPEGQGLVEYALILVLVVFVVFIVVVWIGPWVGNVFSNIIYTL